MCTLINLTSDESRLISKRSAESDDDTVTELESKKPKLETMAVESVIKPEEVKPISSGESTAAPSGAQTLEKGGLRGFKEDPYTYVKPDNEEIKKCMYVHFLILGINYQLLLPHCFPRIAPTHVGGIYLCFVMPTPQRVFWNQLCFSGGQFAGTKSNWNTHTDDLPHLVRRPRSD